MRVDEVEEKIIIEEQILSSFNGVVGDVVVLGVEEGWVRVEVVFVIEK